MVRCDDAASSSRHQVLEQRRGERNTLRRVGARPHLVEKNEGRWVQLPQHRGGGRDVSREGRERLDDRLAIADIDEDLPQGRQLELLRRDMQPAMGHDGQKPDGLQSDRLAARVGARDHQRPLSRLQRECQRDDSSLHSSASSQGLLEDGMAGCRDAQATSPCDLGPDGSLLASQLGSGEGEIQRADPPGGLDEVFPPAREPAGPFGKDPLDLRRLFLARFDQLVVQLDRLHRLEKHGRSAGRNAVHDPLPGRG